MDVRDLIAKAGELADMASILVPQAKLVKGGTIVLSGIMDVFDGLKADAPDASSAAEIDKHKAKVAAVQAKARATSARLRG